MRPCDSGFDAVLFERSADVGGLWGYDNAETSKVFNTVGRGRLTLSNPSRNRAWFRRLKPKCEEPLLHFAFNFNSRRCNTVLQNVTKLHNRFSGHPAPADWPLYLGHRHTMEYLRGGAVPATARSHGGHGGSLMPPHTR